MKKSETKTESTIRVPCEVYSRVVGYLRPTTSWNKAKQQEFKDREVFVIEEDGDDTI